MSALRAGDGARARRALEDLERLLQTRNIQPPRALLALLGGALRMQGRHAEAMALYEEALGRPEGALPIDALIQAEIGECRRIAGETEAALASYRTAAQARVDDADVRQGLALLLVDAGQPEAAIEELRGALARAPAEPGLQAAMGRAYLGAGQPAAAIVWLQDSLRAAPTAARPWFDLGRAFEAAQRPAEARRAYEDFLSRAAGSDPASQTAAERLKELRADG
jgi:tetratricopeptide (TPR) repeat protein